ncbi:MAG TPA: pentapeptide repeat-containing protein [Coleofasciculaceae cyanobacterium]
MTDNQLHEGIIASKVVYRSSVMPMNFSGKNLRGQSFKGKNLTGANFSHADIQCADFSKAILTDANFSHANAGVLEGLANSSQDEAQILLV